MKEASEAKLEIAKFNLFARGCDFPKLAQHKTHCTRLQVVNTWYYSNFEAECSDHRNAREEERCASPLQLWKM